MLFFLAGARLKAVEIMQKNEACTTSISLSYECVKKFNVYGSVHRNNILIYNSN